MTTAPGGPRCAGRAPRAARRTAACAVAVAVLTLAAFWPVSRNGFVSMDDEEYITRNTVVLRGVTAQGVALAFAKSYAANWHPLTWLSHMLDVELFGLDPPAHHLIGLGIHLATALLLLATLQAMTGRAGSALLVAALFAVHPLHVESVAWASERKDVLSALFWVLAMAAYLRYARKPGAGRYLAVLLLFALGLMAKPMVVTLPLALLLLDYWPLGRLRSAAGAAPPPKRPPLQMRILEKAPLLALSVLSGLITVKAQTTGGAVLSMETFPAAARVANALLSYVVYLGKTIRPLDLAVFYPFAIRSPADPRVLAAGAVLAAVSLAVWKLRRSRPWLLTGWLWYLVTLLPVIGLVQVGEQALADRYTYLPLVGIFLAGSWWLDGVARRLPAARGLLAAGAILALLVLAGLTRRQAALWHDDETLFGHAVRVTTGNWKALYSLGTAREAAGDRAGARRLYREAIRLKPDFSKARYAEALALDEEGRAGEAIEELRAAVRALPSDPVIRMALALLLSREGRDDEAADNLRELIAQRPGIAEAHNNLAVLLARRGRNEEALAHLRRALEIDPAYADARANLEALSGGRPDGAGQAAPAPTPGAPSTHRGLFNGPQGR